MALKHFKGSVPTAAGTEWTCPSCKEKQQGPLEAGCVRCGVGKPTSAERQSIIIATNVDEVIDNRFKRKAFDLWYAGAEETQGLAWAAFQAGAAWRQMQTAPQTVPAGNAPNVESGGGTVDPAAVTPVDRATLLFVSTTSNGATDAGPATVATILAALAFYRDNALAYGDVPGQLGADQVTQLIAQLSPADEEVPV